MKPTKHQQQWLKEYLSAVFTYREIYEEVYDHITSALESRTLKGTFEGTIQQVIDGEFGGMNGLIALEENCKDGIVTETRNRYNSYFKWLRFPYIIAIIAVAMVIFYTVMRIKRLFVMFIPMLIVHVFGYFLLLPVVSFIIPIVLLTIRGFRTGYKFGINTVSARDNVFRRLAYLPFRILSYGIIFQTIISFLYNHLGVLPYTLFHFLMANAQLGILFAAQRYLLFIAFLVLPILHLLAFYKIYRSEFKVSVIKQSSN